MPRQKQEGAAPAAAAQQPDQPAAAAPAAPRAKPTKAAQLVLSPRRRAKTRKKAAGRTAPRRAPEVQVRNYRNELDAGSAILGQPKARDMSSIGSIASMNPGLVEVEHRSLSQIQDKAAELAFMEELVEVIVHTTSNNNDDPFPMVAVSGRKQYFERGKTQVVKRKFVGALARARTHGISQSEYTDHNNARALRNHRAPALMFPFSVTRDDNPRGKVWLEEILNQAL